MTYFLESERLCKRFGARTLFENLSFSVSGGEVLTIVGESGSGKSTLLNMLGLLDRPTDGTIRWHGRAITALRGRVARQCIRQHIGYLFQNYALLDNETVERNLSMALTYRSDLRTASARRQAIDEALNQVNLTQHKHQKIYTLSGGEQQRVALARLILKPSSIILADEPTGNLDRENGHQILRRLYRFADEGKAVIIVTHQPERLERRDKVIDIMDYQLSRGGEINYYQ